MAASILNSARAIEVSVYVVRAFVRLREALMAHKEIGKRLEFPVAKFPRPGPDGPRGPLTMVP